MLLYILAAATFFSTLLGGVFALKNRDRLHHILGFTAGILLGVVAFDLLPEIFQLTNSSSTPIMWVMLALVGGFLLFHTIEKLTLIHHAHEGEYSAHKHPQVGLISALALSGHSFLDGVGIGLGLQVNLAVGIAVGIAVISHDFADGLNTVTLMLVNKNSPRRSFKLLILDAVTPILGAFSTLLFTFNDAQLVLYLGFFAGFLLYIGASDILPEAHATHSSRFTLLLTILGAAFIFVIVQVM
jgi:zinc transporter ZupT